LWGGGGPGSTPANPLLLLSVASAAPGQIKLEGLNTHLY
jgi:hypothetical protein